MTLSFLKCGIYGRREASSSALFLIISTAWMRSFSNKGICASTFRRSQHFKHKGRNRSRSRRLQIESDSVFKRLSTWAWKWIRMWHRRRAGAWPENSWKFGRTSFARPHPHPRSLFQSLTENILRLSVGRLKVLQIRMLSDVEHVKERDSS